MKPISFFFFLQRITFLLIPSLFCLFSFLSHLLDSFLALEHPLLCLPQSLEEQDRVHPGIPPAWVLGMERGDVITDCTGTSTGLVLCVVNSNSSNATSTLPW